MRSIAKFLAGSAGDLRSAAVCVARIETFKRIDKSRPGTDCTHPRREKLVPVAPRPFERSSQSQADSSSSGLLALPLAYRRLVAKLSLSYPSALSPYTN